MNRIELSKVLAKVAFGMAPVKRVFVDAVLALNITDNVRKELTALSDTEMEILRSRTMPAGGFKGRQLRNVPWSYLVRVVEFAEQGNNLEKFSDAFLLLLRRYVATIQLHREFPCPPPLPPILSESVLHPDGGRKNVTPPPMIPPPLPNGSLK